jgi:hypothetical protein
MIIFCFVGLSQLKPNSPSLIIPFKDYDIRSPLTSNFQPTTIMDDSQLYTPPALFPVNDTSQHIQVIQQTNKGKGVGQWMRSTVILAVIDDLHRSTS